MDKKLLARFFSCETTPEEEQQIHDWIHTDPVNQKECDEYDFVHNTMLLHPTDKDE